VPPAVITPLILQTYNGAVPALVAVAVKVVDVPAQIVSGVLNVIDIPGGVRGTTVTEIVSVHPVVLVV